MKDYIINDQPYYFNCVPSKYITEKDVKNYVINILSKHNQYTYKLTGFGYSNSKHDEKITINTAKLLLRSGYITDMYIGTKEYNYTFINMIRKRKYSGSFFKRSTDYKNLLNFVIDYFVSRPEKLNVKSAWNLDNLIRTMPAGKEYDLTESVSDLYVLMYPLLVNSNKYGTYSLMEIDNTRFIKIRVALYNAFKSSFLSNYIDTKYCMNANVVDMQRIVDKISKKDVTVYDNIFYHNIEAMMLANNNELEFKHSEESEVIIIKPTINIPLKYKIIQNIMLLIKQIFKSK